MQKILGVIGGMGPMATAVFMERLVMQTDAACDQEHIDIAIRHCPSIADRTAYLLGRSEESPLPRLLSEAKALAGQNACAIAIPCMTAHAFHDEIEAFCGLPVLDTIGETAAFCKREGYARVGVLATEGTIAAGLFQKALAKEGLAPVLPDEDMQRAVTALIFDDIKAGRCAQGKLTALAEAMERLGAQAVILGCTELSVAAQNCQSVSECPFVDVLDILSVLSITACGRRVRAEAQRYCPHKEEPCKGQTF